MAEKKKFEKPQMEAIKLDTKVQVLAGSCPYYACSIDGGLLGCPGDGCTEDCSLYFGG